MKMYINKKFKFCLNIVYYYLVLILFSVANAKVPDPIVLDVYRSNQITAEQIKKEYGKQLRGMIQLYLTPESMSSEENNKKMLKLSESILTGIRKKGDFVLINFSAIKYSGSKVPHFSIEVVDKKDKDRLSHFIKNPEKNVADPDRLIQTWQEYEKIGFKIDYTEKTHPNLKSCPAFHCVFGFEHPLLKKYAAIFNTLVPKDKIQIIEVLQNDKDPRKRQAAAYLLGHLKDGNEIIKILTPFMFDSDNIVRNNAMRVIAETLTKVKNPDFPIDKAIVVLDFPSTTDRNKALYIISSLISQPRYAKYIIDHAGPQLIDVLKLSQENVHGFAYEILRTVSGKKFGERDYKSWENWLKQNKSINS